jgi:hypothetical protein
MVMCGEYVRQFRELEMTEHEFRKVCKARVDASKPDDVRIIKDALRSAVRKREACRHALMSHESDHGCAVPVSISRAGN